MLSAYARFIVRHSYLVLFIVGIAGTILSVVPLICRTLPSFTDPVVGFETRGTTLAHRFIAWNNLIDESRPSRRLAVNPKDIEDQIRMNQTYNNKTRQGKTRNGRPHPAKNKGRNKKKKVKLDNIGYEQSMYKLPDGNVSKDHTHFGYGRNVSFEDEKSLFIRDHTRKQWVYLKEMRKLPNEQFHDNLAYRSCGSPIPDYIHLVVTTTDNTSLLDYNNVRRMCKVQSLLTETARKQYHKLCQRSPNSEDYCCPPWSVPNYIAMVSGKSSCDNITEEDVNTTISILRNCAEYFHNFSLMASCDLDRCKVPKYCSQYDAIYNMLFYLIDSSAFSPPHYSDIFVKNAMIFLPLPSSSTVLSYYMKLQKIDLKYESVTVSAMDFGLKNALFDLWIIEDAWLVGLGGIFVFLCVWIYAKSLILTLLLFLAITYSLGISYFFYIYVFNLEFFPFMNLLVIVVVIGIGADDAFLYVKVWNTVSKQLVGDNVPQDGLTNIKNIHSAGETMLVQILEETLRHTLLTIFITTMTTAFAFLASYVSYIPAINCFSVFAGTSVIINFVLMITWLPASVFVLEVKLCQVRITVFDFKHKRLNNMLEDLRVIFGRFIMTCVTKLQIVFVTVFGAIGIYSIVVVFYSPGLKLPDSRQFQLFQSSHPFEVYDINYRDKFLFERFSSDLDAGSKMPLRWIWGVRAIDNGNHMNPSSTGELVLDESFTMSDPNSQLWLLRFCARLKAQPFYQQMLGPLLPNCFIESFKMYMSRKCVDRIDNIDRTPCCEESRFPFKKEIFDLCIIKAIESLYQTSREIFIPGVAGPKFLKTSKPPKIVAVVVEFESVVPYSMSYAAMNNFFIHVENWTQNELISAPPGMKCGWFLSDLQFYDLQGTLARGTVIALVLSASLGFVVLLPATLSLIISICALSAMIFSCTVTIAILVLSNWKLNVLESVAISTSAGLAVDFSLHYALSYTSASGTTSARVKSSLSTSAGPTAAAALTTGFSGIFLLRSHLLPYSQIGTFLALIMSVSWLYATFFLCSLLHIFGTHSKEALTEERKSTSRVSSVCSGIPNLESHELEQLADSSRTNITHSHSPSSISATTVVLHDELDNCNHRVENKMILISKCDNELE